jgi:hypothetical protein
VPEGDLKLEIVSPSGASEPVAVAVPEVNKLVTDAAAKAQSVGFRWMKKPLDLKAAPKLLALVKRSRAEDVPENAGN